MNADADLSLHGLAKLLAEFIERLGLDHVILVAVDWGGPKITAARATPNDSRDWCCSPKRRFTTSTPGLPGKFAGIAGRMPSVFLQSRKRCAFRC